MDATEQLAELPGSQTPTPPGTKDEKGMTTAEYTVGTLGACSVAAILIKLAQTEWFGELIKGLLENITGIAGF